MRREDDPDRDILSAVACGDRRALAALYERHAGALLVYLARLTGEAQAAEDLVQEVFLIAWRDAEHFRGEARVRTWLFGIAHNLGLMALRRRREHPVDELDPPVEERADPAADAEAWADLALDRERLSAALRGLSAEGRAVIELVFYHGLKRDEVARVLGCPVGTVKSRLHYALRALAARMGEGGQ